MLITGVENDEEDEAKEKEAKEEDEEAGTEVNESEEKEGEVDKSESFRSLFSFDFGVDNLSRGFQSRDGRG